MTDSIAGILDRYGAGKVPANVAAMQVLIEARSAAEAASRIAERLDGTADRRFRDLLDLLARHPGAWDTIRTVMREADHGRGGAGPAHWAAVFDRLAATAPEAGVALYALGSPDLAAAATAEVVARMGEWGLLGRDRSLLEVGCGNGRLTLALAPVMRRVTGLDVSAAMVADARRRAAGHANAEFAATSGEDFAAVASGSVDVVLASDVFPYLVGAGTDPEEAGADLARRHVDEAARVLRPGGALLILNYSYRPDPQADERDVGALFAGAGFRPERLGTRDLDLWDGRTFLGRRP